MTIPNSVLDLGANTRPVGRQVTAELLARHDRPGPRYTSYPTAIEFHEGVGTDDYLTRLAEADQLGDAPLSLYMHLPFCEERCLFCGCHVIVTKHRKATEPYLELIKREVELLADVLPGAGYQTLPGQTHNIRAEVLAPALVAFFRASPPALARLELRP